MSGREISSSGGDQGGEQGKTPDRDEVPDPRNSYNQYPHAESQKDREILGPTPTGDPSLRRDTQTRQPSPSPSSSKLRPNNTLRPPQASLPASKSLSTMAVGQPDTPDQTEKIASTATSLPIDTNPPPTRVVPPSDQPRRSRTPSRGRHRNTPAVRPISGSVHILGPGIYEGGTKQQIGTTWSRNRRL